MKVYAALAGCLLAFATTTHVTGQVLDDDRPVPGADVEVALLTGSATSVTARTDSAGRFSVQLGHEGIYRLSAKRVGYEPAVSAITVSSGDELSVTIQLHRLAQRLDSVVVVDPLATPARYGAISRMDEFYERRARGVGKFFTRDELDSLGESSLAALLRRVPGVRVTGRSDSMFVIFARCQGTALPNSHQGDNNTGPIALFIDGTQVMHQAIPVTLADLHMADVEALEVFRGPTELPMQAIGNACGAIYVWTRFGPGPLASPPPSAHVIRQHTVPIP